ncbi:MAG: phosphoglycerol geranylgeranyltransferase [Paraglaciecola sp.]|jgi:phosphoglycerol geranylgeranyltransferase
MIIRTDIYKDLCAAKAKGEKKFVLLIDPDEEKLGNLERVLDLSMQAGVDYFFVGGSLIVEDRMEFVLRKIKALSSIPTVLFPSSPLQVNDKADAILFLSLISGRNSEFLIGNHVISAPYLKKSSLEILSTGYMLVDGGKPTTASYMSNTSPIPYEKDEIAMCTAMAGEMLGLKLMYLDGGSGAKNPVSTSMIKSVSQAINAPLIVGGGIRTPEKALANVEAGADVVVVGNAIEKNPKLIFEMAEAVHSLNLV